MNIACTAEFLGRPDRYTFNSYLRLMDGRYLSFLCA